MASYRLVILIAQAQSKRTCGRNCLGATLAGAVLMHRGESESPSEAQPTDYGNLKRVPRFLLATPTAWWVFKIKIEASESFLTTATLGNRVPRD